MESELKKLAELLDKLEERKHQSFSLVLQSDGSSSIDDFWTEESIFYFDTIPQLIKFLNEVIV